MPRRREPSAVEHRWVLIESCLPMLKRYTKSRSRDRDHASELLQETCLQLLRIRSAPHEVSDFQAWSRGVARHVASHQRRRSRRRGGVELRTDAVDVRDAAIGPDRYLDFRETLSRMARTIEAEPLALFVRHYALGEKISELAHERAQSAAALRMRFMRVRAAIRADGKDSE